MNITTGKRALIEVLRQEGVEYVFGIPGATEIHFMDALEEAPEIKYILGLQEVVCAGMAEGYARATGRPAFLNLHTASGLAAASPLLYNAKLGGVPLVVTVGQNDTRLLQLDPHLTGDIVGIGRPHAKWATELVHAEDIPVVIQRAFKMALQPPTGPVVVSLPQNVLQQEFDFTHAPRTEVRARLRPDTTAVAKAVEILVAAERPLLLVESGVARSGALDEVVRFAELIGARVHQAWMADVNFPVAHPQYLGDLDPTDRSAEPVLKEADVLIGVGCSLFSAGFYDSQTPSVAHAKIIHIDDDPWEIGKNLRTDCGIQGDIKTVLTELNTALQVALAAGLPAGGPDARERVRQRTAELAEEKTQALAELQERWTAQRNRIPIAPSRLMTEVASATTPDTVIVDDCWSSSGILREILAPSQAGRYYRSRKGGSIGWGLPGALGVKLGMPRKQVVAVLGDGSAAWSIQGLWTAARYRIPVTFVITNNATYGQVKLVRRQVLGDYPLEEKHEGMELDRPIMEFSLLAKALGVEAERVQAPHELGPVLRRATSSGEPRLVEIIVGR
ncbi:MAG: thiamine pyrophosphate-binding protein [Actinobacteria bacterium]|jgi:benzoylformate decarboxylase|nr:thiamine pyrophosphate-binding protein [Actinomycetota bacterium]